MPLPGRVGAHRLRVWDADYEQTAELMVTVEASETKQVEVRLTPKPR